jgi:hypothetical protein
MMAEIDKMSDMVSDVAPIGPILDKLDNKVVNDAVELAKVVASSHEGVRKVLLDESMCDAAPKVIDEKFKQALKLPAAFDKQYFMLSLTVTFTSATYHATETTSLTWLTNLGGDGGLYLSAGMGATSSEEPVALEVGVMYFPNTTLADFMLSPVPSISVSLAKGKALEEMLKGKGMLVGAAALVDGIAVSWVPDKPTTLPTLGFSKGIVAVGGNPEALVQVAASTGWDFPLFTYKNWTMQ